MTSNVKLLPLPCPFCGNAPEVGPPDDEGGSAWGRVTCANEDCPAQPIVDDGENVADERGRAAYQQVAIARWNTRACVEANSEALRAEVDRLKQMLGECYVEAGADTDGNEPSRMYAQALSAVQDLRRDYDETLAEPDYKARAERLAEALREIERRMPKDRAGPPWIARTIAAEALHPTAAQETSCPSPRCGCGQCPPIAPEPLL